MNTIDRKYIIIAVTFFLALGALVGGVALWQYFTSFHQVTFNLQPANLTADIYQVDASTSKAEKLERVKNGQQLRLQEGKYYAAPQDKKYDMSHITFEVKEGDMAVDIEPGYSDTYLIDLLKKEQPAINKAILEKYPAITASFTLKPGKLYLDGTWYAVSLVKTNPNPGGESSDVYTTVLHKVNGTWQFVGIPKIVLTVPENPDIPERILKELNTL